MMPRRLPSYRGRAPGGETGTITAMQQVSWDSDGMTDDVRVLNQCARERIDVRFLPLIEEARAGMVACCGDGVREIRLQGSIARGDARLGHADLDMIALTEGPPPAAYDRCLRELAATLGADTSLVSRLDLEAVDRSTLAPFRQFALSSDSLCIHGLDSLTAPVQEITRTALARLVTPNPDTMLPDYLAWVEELDTADDTERRHASRIIGKDLLRVLRGVLLLRGASYEVSIPGIAAQAKDFSLEMARAAPLLFQLYAEPTVDVRAIRGGAEKAVTMLRNCPELVMLRDPEAMHGTSPVAIS